MAYPAPEAITLTSGDDNALPSGNYQILVQVTLGTPVTVIEALGSTSWVSCMPTGLTSISDTAQNLALAYGVNYRIRVSGGGAIEYNLIPI